MTFPDVPLGEVCKVNPRLEAADNPGPDRLVTFVPMAAVDEREARIAARQDRPLREVAKGFTAFREGDVLFAKITPCMENGKVALATGLTNGLGRGSTEFFVIRPNGKILPEYVFHFLRQDAFRQEAKRNFTGTAGQQRVPRTFMENARIPLPPLEEQRRIGDILNRAASIRRLRDQANATLRALIPALFIKMFGDPRTMAERFPTRPLREVADIGSGATKGRRLAPDEIEEVPYLRVANVQDGYLELGEIRMIAIRKGEADRYALRPGDLVMTEGGDPDKLGRAAIWQGELPYCAHQNHVFRVRADGRHVLPLYLREAAGSAYGKRYFLSVAKQTTGIASINKTQLGAFPVPLPPLADQERFARLLTRAHGAMQVSESATRGGEALGASLLNRLMKSGARKLYLPENMPQEVWS